MSKNDSRNDEKHNLRLVKFLNMSKELLFRSFEVKNLALRSNFEINASKQIVNQNDALDVNYLKQEIL